MHSSFVYPDGSEIQGSTFVFTALLESWLNMDQILLCRSVPRRWVSPRLVAFLPQRETLDNHGFQINPPEFYLVVLPFIGKVRNLQLEGCAKDLDDDSTFEEAVQTFSKIMEKLELSNGFAPQEVKNPWL